MQKGFPEGPQKEYRGGGLGWGAKDTGGEVLWPSKKSLLPFKCMGENEISEILIATTEKS
jgi:hypothetical protein